MVNQKTPALKDEGVVLFIEPPNFKFELEIGFKENVSVKRSTKVLPLSFGFAGIRFCNLKGHENGGNDVKEALPLANFGALGIMFLQVRFRKRIRETEEGYGRRGKR